MNNPKPIGRLLHKIEGDLFYASDVELYPINPNPTTNKIDDIIFRLKDRRHYLHIKEAEEYSQGYRDGLTEAINYLNELSNLNRNKL